MKGKKMNAISLKFYDNETSEVTAEYHQTFMPFGLLKTAMKLMERLEGKQVDQIQIQDLGEDFFDDLGDFVVDLFGRRFTREELANHTDAVEVITVLVEAVNKIKKSGDPT